MIAGTLYSCWHLVTLVTIYCKKKILAAFPCVSAALMVHNNLCLYPITGIGNAEGHAGYVP